MIKTKPKETQFEEIAKQSGVSKAAARQGRSAVERQAGPRCPVNPALKQDAAKKVFQEGVTGKDHGADEAMAKLPHINVPKQGN